MYNGDLASATKRLKKLPHLVTLNIGHPSELLPIAYFVGHKIFYSTGHPQKCYFDIEKWLIIFLWRVFDSF